MRPINTEAETGKEVPTKQKAERETRNTDAQTQNVGSAEPSLTIKQPSSLSKKRKTAIPEDAVCTEPFYAIAEKEGHCREKASAQFERMRDNAVAQGALGFQGYARRWNRTRTERE